LNTKNLLDGLSELDRAMLILCAHRLDKECNADQFIGLIDKVVEAAKDEKEDQLARDASP